MPGLIRFNSHPLQATGSASALTQITWQGNDLPVPPSYPSTDPGWRSKISNWLRRIFPPSDVRLARTIEEYQLRLAANDFSGSGKCAYRLGYELWNEKRYSTAEHLWYTGARHFVDAAGSEDSNDPNVVFYRLRRDAVLNLYPLKWGEGQFDSTVMSQIGAGFQGEAKKLFGKKLIIKSPRSLADMDPRSTGVYSPDSLRNFRKLNLGREIENMLRLQAEGFRTAGIHYVDPDYHFCIKDLIIGPSIRGLYSYGLSEEQIEEALAKHKDYIARDPVVDNINSNTLYDVNAREWTIIDA